MPLKEIKNNWQHYYENAAGQIHGEYKEYRHWPARMFLHKKGQLWQHCHFKNGKLQGEYKRYDKDSQLECHTYDVNNVEVHNFLKDGDSEFIRVCLYMTHGAPFLT